MGRFGEIWGDLGWFADLARAVVEEGHAKEGEDRFVRGEGEAEEEVEGEERPPERA